MTQAASCCIRTRKRRRSCDSSCLLLHPTRKRRRSFDSSCLLCVQRLLHRRVNDGAQAALHLFCTFSACCIRRLNGGEAVTQAAALHLFCAFSACCIQRVKCSPCAPTSLVSARVCGQYKTTQPPSLNRTRDSTSSTAANHQTNNGSASGGVFRVFAARPHARHIEERRGGGARTRLPFMTSNHLSFCWRNSAAVH